MLGIKNIIMLLLLCGVMNVSAQTMRQVWMDMPDEMVVYLNRSNRTELADYVEMKVRIPQDDNFKFHKVAEIVKQRYGLRVHKFTRSELVSEGWGREVFHLLNATYKDLYGINERPQHVENGTFL